MIEKWKKRAATAVFAVLLFVLIGLGGCEGEDAWSEPQQEEAVWSEPQQSGSEQELQQKEAPWSEPQQSGGVPDLAESATGQAEQMTQPTLQGDAAGSPESAAQKIAAQKIAAQKIAVQESEPAGPLVIYVCGAVANPGVYELPPGSRLVKAVERAGGFSAEACEEYWNLAAPLADGMKVEVPTRSQVDGAKKQGKTWKPEAQGSLTAGADGVENSTAAGSSAVAVNPAASESSAAGEGGSGTLVNINTADVNRLCTLPGVGKSRAEQIIAYRTASGGFEKKEDIMKVTGIKEGMYRKLEAKIVVE